jgi:hypothetical protein
MCTSGSSGASVRLLAYPVCRQEVGGEWEKPMNEMSIFARRGASPSGAFSIARFRED